MYLLLKIGDFPGNHVSFQEAILFDCHILPYQIPRDPIPDLQALEPELNRRS